MLRLLYESCYEIALKQGETSGKQSSISDLIGRPQYTAFKANAPIDIFQVYDDSSIPDADDYLMDADYQIKTYLSKNSSRRQTNELCSNLPKISIPVQKMNLDNKNRWCISRNNAACSD